MRMDVWYVGPVDGQSANMISLFKTVIHEEAIKNVTEVLKSGWVGLGPKVEEFEHAFAEYIGTPYAIAFNSCTEALRVAVKISGLKEGYSAISTPLTFVSTNHVLLYEKITPIFADTDLLTGCIDLDSVHRLCKAYHPQGLMVVHYGGNVINLDKLYDLAKEYQLTVIEDCAHACGSSFRGEKIGARSRLACFSFHAVKNLPLGDGGMLTTTDEELAVRARKLRWLGIDKTTVDRHKQTYGWRYDVDEIGYKGHMNDITAAMGLGQLPHLDEDNAHRHWIYSYYRTAGLPMLLETQGTTSSHHLAVMLAWSRADKENTLARLQAHDIQYGIHYLPNYYYPMYKTCKRECRYTEEFYNRCISLPNHLDLRLQDLIKVVTAMV